MDKTATIGSLTSAAIFSTGVVIAIANSIRIKTAEGAPWWRFWSLIPHGIYGGFAIQAAFHTRYDSNGVQSKLGPIFVSQSIHGMAVSLLIPFACYVGNLISFPGHPSITMDTSRESFVQETEKQHRLATFIEMGSQTTQQWLPLHLSH